MKNFTCALKWKVWINFNDPLCTHLYSLCPSFNIIKKYVTIDHMFTLSYIFFSCNIFNVCIIFIWFNAMCIIPNVCSTITKYEHDIGSPLFYNKWSLICRFVSVCSMIVEQDLISILLSYSTRLYFCRYHLYLFSSAFADVLITIQPYVLSG